MTIHNIYLANVFVLQKPLQTIDCYADGIWQYRAFRTGILFNNFRSVGEIVMVLSIIFWGMRDGIATEIGESVLVATALFSHENQLCSIGL